MEKPCEKVIVSTIQEAATYIEGHILFDFCNEYEGITFVIIKDNNPFKIVISHLKYTYLPFIPVDAFDNPVKTMVETVPGNNNILITLENGFLIHFDTLEYDYCEHEYKVIQIPLQTQPVTEETLNDFLISLHREGIELKNDISVIQHGFIPKEKGFLFIRKNPYDSSFTESMVIPATVTINNQSKDINIIFQHFIAFA